MLEWKRRGALATAAAVLIAACGGESERRAELAEHPHEHEVGTAPVALEAARSQPLPAIQPPAREESYSGWSKWKKGKKDNRDRDRDDDRDDDDRDDDDRDDRDDDREDRDWDWDWDRDRDDWNPRPWPNPGPKPAPAPPEPTPAPGPTPDSLPEPTVDREIDARILVLSADGTEVVLPAIRQALDYLGTPYDVYVARQTPNGLTADKLADGNRARYQAVILTSAALSYFDGTAWASALTPEEWQTLYAFEAEFGIRQVSWYAYPTPELGFEWPNGTVDTLTAPIEASFTAEGAALFGYMNTASKVTIKNAWTYLARPAGADTRPLLVDAAGNALMAVKTHPDGRENLAMTFDGAEYLIHSVALSYGVINWATRGLFVGYRRVYMGVHVDDVFLENDLWGNGVYNGNGTWRMASADLWATATWQNRRRLTATGSGLKLDMVYNGYGATKNAFPNDTLTPAARVLQGSFKWINHTYTHLNLDAVDYNTARGEFAKNLEIARNLRLSAFDARNLVNPQISGLDNPAAMKAAWDVGIRYVVSDTSRPGHDAAVKNGGVWNWHERGILMIPRRPTNLFYNVSTPDEWVSEYNHLYRAYWGRDLSYEEILDRESDVLLTYLLRGEIDPWMFHQSNLRFYDGKRSLLTDLLDRTFDKYDRHYRLPVVSPTQDELGVRVKNRMDLAESGLEATIRPGGSITLKATRATVVPVTGLGGTGAETYGGQKTRFVKLSAGQTVTVPLP